MKKMRLRKKGEIQEGQQSWVLSKQERAFLETLEQINDWDNASEMEEIMEKFRECSISIDMNYYFYLVIRAFQKDGYKNDYLDKVINENDYQEWLQAYTVNGLMQSKVLCSSEIMITLITKYANLYNRLELIKRKDYYSYLIEQGEAEESFEDHIRKYGETIIKDENKAKDEEIRQLEELSNVVFPNELKEFYKEIGGIYISETFGILPVQTMIKALQDTSPSKLKGLGIIDMLFYCWGNDREDIFSYLKEEEISFLNKTYLSFGYILENDNEVWILYVDPQGFYGAVHYDQDSDVAYQKYLYPMLKKSLAKRTLSEILVTALAEEAICKIQADISFEIFEDWEKIV